MSAAPGERSKSERPRGAVSESDSVRVGRSRAALSSLSDGLLPTGVEPCVVVVSEPCSCCGRVARTSLREGVGGAAIEADSARMCPFRSAMFCFRGQQEK